MRLPALLPTLLSLLVTAGCAPRTATPDGEREAAQAGDFTLRTVEGQTFRLSDHLGKQVILLNFWATWCVPCLGEMPELEKLHQRYRDQGLLVVGVSMDGPESVANVQPTVRRYGLTYPILLDEETRVVGVYNPRRDAPFSVLIDRQGRIVQRFVGYAPGDEVKLEESIRPLLDAGDAGTGS
jgi:peroxiredoxin